MQAYDIRDFENRVFEIDGLYAIEYTGYSMRPHRHAAIEVTYVENGKCDLEIYHPVNHSMTRVPVTSNNFIILNSGTYHALHVDDDVTCALKTIEFKTVDRPANPVGSIELGLLLRCSLTFRNMITEARPYIVLCDTAQIVRVMTEIIYLHNSYRWELPNDKYMLLQLKIAEFLLKMNDCTLVSGMGNVGVVYIKRAQQLIREHYMDGELTPEEIARQIGVTKHYLMTLFQKHLGHTMLHEINSVRIEQACSKILNTTDSLIEIGFSCGYNTRQSFFANFRKITGTSPSQFRYRNKHISIYSYAEIHDDEL